MEKYGNGNVNTKQPNGRRGWIFGNLPDIRLPYPWNYRGFQIKWADLEENDDSKGIKPAENTTTISILVRGGPHEIILYDEHDVKRIHRLDKEGDFVFWGPGIKHEWKALKKNMTITLRWKENWIKRTFGL